ncbi:MAG: methyltransferase [Oscillospiraceae bacterium]|nr:methyltransferase [Oscillospiraceae bacterium]
MNKNSTPLYEGEHIEELGNGIGLIVSKNHTFGTDALILAHFAAPKKRDIACDLGSGCGIIPFLWLRDGLCEKICAVEIQENACEQMSRSLAGNNNEKITVFNRDLKQLDSVFETGSFDLVTMNPPYKGADSGIKNDDECARIARHEVACNIDDIARCASRLLRFGGRFCICHRPERVFDAMTAMHEHGIEPKRLRFVSKRGDTQPWLVLIEGRRGGQNGLKVEKPLLVETDTGTPSSEMLLITEKYRKTVERQNTQ